MKLLLVLILISTINFIKCQKTITLSATIYDHSPYRNPDFEIQAAGPPGSVHEGIVLEDLNPITKVPTYCCGSESQYDLGRIMLHNETTFNQWFTYVEDVNYPIPYELVLTETAPDSGIYKFGTNRFFPIDGRGFGNKTEFPLEFPQYEGHDFHFCMTVHASFPYAGGEILDFAGDDDVWIFFNNKLLVDIGGLHPMANRTVDLDIAMPGLVVGTYYDWDMFYCERHTDNSDLFITINFGLVCEYYDICGVCEGKSDTCCLDGCVDVDMCSIASCGPDSNYSCIQTPVVCNDNDACTSETCDPAIGCVYVAINCTNSDECTLNLCDSTLGCFELPVNCDDGDHCTTDTCEPVIGCVHTEIVNCRPCIPSECPTIDLCFPQECNPVTGARCITHEINCTSDDPCIDSRCEEGLCVFDNICTPTPTDTPTPTPTTTPSPTVSPTVSPTPTPRPLPPQPREDIRKGCLSCHDLGCDQNNCKYINNPKYHDNHKSDCCKYTPTCF